jgi:hypothetical protein
MGPTQSTRGHDRRLRSLEGRVVDAGLNRPARDHQRAPHHGQVSAIRALVAAKSLTGVQWLR